jgi:hypothetical protein
MHFQSAKQYHFEWISKDISQKLNFIFVVFLLAKNRQNNTARFHPSN